jgi:hypothetical protein
MQADIGEAQRLGVLDQDTEDPQPARQIPDPRAGILVDPQRQETLETVTPLVQDPERRIACTSHIARGLENSVEDDSLIEVRDKGLAHLEQAHCPWLLPSLHFGQNPGSLIVR